MSLSPNAGKDKYLLEKKTGIIHNLKFETENCKVLDVTPSNASLVQTYKEAEDLSLFKYGNVSKPCKYCCEE